MKNTSIGIGLAKLAELQKIPWTCYPTQEALDPDDEVDFLCRANGSSFREFDTETVLQRKNFELPILLLDETLSSAYLLYQDGLYSLGDAKMVQVTSRDSLHFYPHAYQMYRPLPSSLSIGQLALWLMSPHKKKLVTLFLYGLFAALLGLFFPISVQILCDYVIAVENRSLLWVLFSTLIVVAINASSFLLIQNRLAASMQSCFMHDVMTTLWLQLLHYSKKLLSKFTVGDIFTRIISLEYLQEIMAQGVMNIAISLFFSLLYFVLMVIYNPSLTVIVASIFLLFGAVNFVLVRQLLRLRSDSFAMSSKVNSRVLQFIRGIPLIQMTKTESNFLAFWQKAFSPFLDSKRKEGICQSMIELINIIAPFTIIAGVYAAYLLKISYTDNVSIGSHLAFFSSLGAFNAALFWANSTLVSLTKAVPLWERIREVIETTDETRSYPRMPKKTLGGIELRSISFSYDKQRPILNNFSLKAAAGEFVGIIGPSGSGKSTILRLLLGLEKPDAGEILYDNKPYSEWDHVFLHRQIGVVLQNSTIFDGTFWDNVVCGRKLTEKEVAESLELASLTKFTESLPMGLHTILSNKGTNFSQGERQRILLVRALLGKPKILLLDEATSQLDTLTQKTIIYNLEQLNITRIVVAHRPSTIQHADNIYKIVEI